MQQYIEAIRSIAQGRGNRWNDLKDSPEEPTIGSGECNLRSN